MKSDPTSRGIEIVTAVMLGLASVVTALGAWQAGQWTAIADEYKNDASDARDVSIIQSVASGNSLRVDQEASAQAMAYRQLAEQATDETVRMFYEFSVTSALSRSTGGFADAWEDWAAGGFQSADNPLTDPQYLVGRDGSADSYAFTSTVLGSASSAMKDRAAILAQASLVYALALFLFGISGVNRLREVRGGVVGLGVAIFVGGLVLASTAF